MRSLEDNFLVSNFKTSCPHLHYWRRKEPQARARIHHTRQTRVGDLKRGKPFREDAIKSNLLGVSLHVDYCISGVNNTKSIIMFSAIVYAQVRQRHINTQSTDTQKQARKCCIYRLFLMIRIIRIIWLLSFCFNNVLNVFHLSCSVSERTVPVQQEDQG